MWKTRRTASMSASSPPTNNSMSPRMAESTEPVTGAETARPALGLVHHGAPREGDPHRFRQGGPQGHAPAGKVILEVIDGNGRADLEFEKGRQTLRVDAKVDREAVTQSDKPRKSRRTIENPGEGVFRALVTHLAQIGHARNEGGLAPEAEAAVSVAPDSVSLSFMVRNAPPASLAGFLTMRTTPS